MTEARVLDGCETMLVADVLADYHPGQYNATRTTWDAVEADLHSALCVCRQHPGSLDPEALPEHITDEPAAGHYQRMLEAHIAINGVPGSIVVGDLDGTPCVWDGHHRLVAARRLGIKSILVEAWA